MTLHRFLVPQLTGQGSVELPSNESLAQRIDRWKVNLRFVKCAQIATNSNVKGVFGDLAVSALSIHSDLDVFNDIAIE